MTRSLVRIQVRPQMPNTLFLPICIWCLVVEGGLEGRFGEPPGVLRRRRNEPSTKPNPSTPTNIKLSDFCPTDSTTYNKGGVGESRAYGYRAYLEKENAP